MEYILLNKQNKEIYVNTFRVSLQTNQIWTIVLEVQHLFYNYFVGVEFLTTPPRCDTPFIFPVAVAPLGIPLPPR